jgi:hypothetical protein
MLELALLHPQAAPPGAPEAREGTLRETPNRAVAKGPPNGPFFRRFSRIWTWSWQRATIGIAARYKELVEDAQLRKAIFRLRVE